MGNSKQTVQCVPRSWDHLDFVCSEVVFIVGKYESTTCPGGLVAISSQQRCEEYGAQSGESCGFEKMWTESNRPTNCWQDKNGCTLYSVVSAGNAYASARPVCTQANAQDEYFLKHSD